ncbi:MAG: hypothetical protein ACMV0I_02535, partial [Pseudomonas sp.]
YLNGATMAIPMVDASNVANAEGAINAAANWTDVAGTSWVVISGTTTSAVYQWVEAGGGSSAGATGELTLVGTITGAVTFDQILV